MKSQPSQKNNYHKLKKRLFFLKKNNLEKIQLILYFKKRYIDILYCLFFYLIKLNSQKKTSSSGYSSANIS